jgi:uncharacterized metal-binding protein YceD (DUF177 family)
MMDRSARVPVDVIGGAPREVVLTPDAAARAALAERLQLPEVTTLTCAFTLSRDRAGTVIARGQLDATVVQEDVTTLEPFSADLHDAFTIRFVPEADLRDALDPEDPVDEVGYDGGALDLHEAMCEQLALALDPYPHKPDAGH